jgi:DNA-binding NtrC family response regulator
MNDWLISTNQAILIVDPDMNFREELYNFLLSAGYQHVDSAVSFTDALERLRESEYEIVVTDAGSPFVDAVRFARSVSEIEPAARVIFMIRADDQQEWNRRARSATEFQFVIKPDFQRSLLYVLEQC